MHLSYDDCYFLEWCFMTLALWASCWGIGYYLARGKLFKGDE